MHDDIRRFSLTGTISQDKLLQTRERLIEDVEAGMRDEGYVPVLDLYQQFTREYDPGTGTFSFEVSVYGVYVGESAWQQAGMTNGILVEKYIPLAK